MISTGWDGKRREGKGRGRTGVIGFGSVDVERESSGVGGWIEIVEFKLYDIGYSINSSVFHRVSEGLREWGNQVSGCKGKERKRRRERAYLLSREFLVLVSLRRRLVRACSCWLGGEKPPFALL